MDFGQGQRIFIKGTVLGNAKTNRFDTNDYMLISLDGDEGNTLLRINKRYLKEMKPTDSVMIPVSYKLPKLEAMAVDIASLLIKFRINHDFLLSDIARMLSISVSDLESIENGDGSKISLDLIVAVEQLTGVEFITSPLKERE